GDFNFNWIGLRNKASGVIAAISHIPTVYKLKTILGVQNGNSVTRSIMMSYNDAKGLTNIDVDASTWQIDFTARLFGMDEAERLANIDVFGQAAFLSDGFKVEKSGSNYIAKAGRGYVGGLRCHLAADLTLAGIINSTSIYLDVSWQGQLTSQWQTVFVIKISNTPLADYVDGHGYQHYVTKIADIDGAGNVTDCRVIEGFAEYYQQAAADDLLDKKIDKASITDSVTSISSILVASAKGLKTAYDKAVSAYNLAASKMTQATGDGRYLAKTATAADSSLLGGRSPANFSKVDSESAIVAAGKWIRIATGQRRSNAEFVIAESASGQHGYVRFQAGISYGNSPYINILGSNGYASGNGALRHVRIVDLDADRTYGQKAVEVYFDSVSSITTHLLIDLGNHSGWMLITPVESTGTATERVSLDLDKTTGLHSSGAIYENNERVYSPHNLPVEDIWLQVAAKICPVGVPLPWPHSTIPAGFLECRGQSFNKTTYQELAKAYPSGVIKDLRSEFIRGWDNGRGVDIGRAIGSSQGDAIRNITGAFKFNRVSRASVSGVFESGGSNGASGNYMTGGDSSNDTVFDASKVVPTAADNRPRNIAFMYIVRAA
ncbi:phage tail protein, partial [Moritella viscosa]